MCEPIDIPMCAGMPYNMTRMPNHLHHSSQANARLAIEPYGELIKQNCSADLLFFLCAMFAPICTPQFQMDAIPPCRSVCERSRQGCEPLINKYNFSWPDDLDCNKLPEYDKGVCVSPEAIVSSMPEESKPSTEERIETKVIKKECKCKEKLKPTKTAYKKGKFHYAISAVVKHTTVVDESSSVVRVTVTKILQRGKIHLQESRDMDLWSNTSCVCPALKLNREYLIIGREDVLLNRLMLSETSLVARWNRKWESKVKKWSSRRRKNKKRRCKKRKCRKNNSKNKLRCRVEQSGESSTRIKCTRPKKNDRNRKKQENSLKRIRNDKTRHRHKKRKNITNVTK